MEESAMKIVTKEITEKTIYCKIEEWDKVVSRLEEQGFTVTISNAARGGGCQIVAKQERTRETEVKS